MRNVKSLAGPATNDLPEGRIPVIELAMLTYVTLLAADYDTRAPTLEVWSVNPPPTENEKQLYGLSIFHAPRLLLEDLEQAFKDPPCTWKLVRRKHPGMAYIYDTRA